jgi:hypothetical protein
MKWPKIPEYRAEIALRLSTPSNTANSLSADKSRLPLADL